MSYCARVAEENRTDPFRARPAAANGTNHRVHAEVLADVAQEADQVELRQPVEVVDDARRVRTLEVEEALELLALAGEVGVEQFGGEQVALRRLAARIPDHAGAATDDRDGVMSRALQAHQPQHLEQASHVQAVGRGIEADVGRDGSRAQQRHQLVRRGLVHEAARREVRVEIGLRHDPAP
jgi:hypothetical protein